MRHTTSTFWTALVASTTFALALAGCSADAADAATDDTDATEALRTQRSSEFHGTVSIDMMTALEPDSRLHSPWDWDIGRQQVVVAAATIDRDHLVHSWDVEVTDDETKIDLTAQAIKVFANGKPDLEDEAVRDNWVPDIDTKMTLFKKEASGFKFVASNDDGISDSKGSWIERPVERGATYHVVVEVKHPNTRGVVGLYVGAMPLHPSDP
jgi:hypothetical protein